MGLESEALVPTTSLSSEKAHDTDLVLARRGRWVVKLAIALFLCRKGLRDEGILSVMHGEMWSYEQLGIEALRRGYAPHGTEKKAAQRIWKVKLGVLWLEQGFEACEDELEPYLQRQFERLKGEGTAPRLGLSGKAENPCDNTGAAGAVVAPAASSPDVGVFEEEVAKKLAKLYEDALRYLRRLEPKVDGPQDGWVSAQELYSNLMDRKRDRASDEIGGTKGGYAALLPTTPGHLLTALSQLDLLGRLQFRWECTSEGGDLASDAPKETLSASVRASWAHKNPSLSSAVLASHPTMTLGAALECFSPRKEIYDFVESVGAWEATARERGREVPSFRPFLLFAVGDSIKRRLPTDPVWRAASLMAGKITEKSAFFAVDKNFLGLHLQRPVFVVRSDIFQKEAGTSKESNVAADQMNGVVLLLHSCDIVSSTIAGVGKNSQVLYVKSEALYGDRLASMASIRSIRLLVGESQPDVEGKCARRVPLFSSLNEGVTVLQEAIEPMGSSEAPVTDGSVFLRPPTLPASITEASRGLRLVVDGITSSSKEAFFKSWVKDICAMMKDSDSDDGKHRAEGGCGTYVEKVLGAAPWSADYTFSLLIAGKAEDSGIRPHGMRSLSQELLASIVGGACHPFYVKNRQQHTVTLYFQSNKAGEGEPRAPIHSAPLLLLRPLRRASSANTELMGEEESLSDCRSALVLSLDRAGNCSSDGSVFKNLTAIELSEGERKVADDLCNASGSAAQLWSSSIYVEEWSFEELLPLQGIIEEHFIGPIKRCICNGVGVPSSTELSEVVWEALVPSLREQLLTAMTPKANEALEYLGDAVLDFVVAQQVLCNWAGGPITDATVNVRLADRLPSQLCNYFELKLGVTNKKRRADIVEALFGAVAMTFWVIPRIKLLETAEKADNASPQSPRFQSLPPSSVMFSAIRTLMDVLNITCS